METSRTNIEQPAPGTFAERVGVELNRAERYRVFVSLTVLDLKTIRGAAGDTAGDVVNDVLSAVRKSIRACDYAHLIDNENLALLLPETPRQGAEIAARRLVGIIKDVVRDRTGESSDSVIPVEIASYPDTAGARTLHGFLEDLVVKSRN